MSPSYAGDSRNTFAGTTVGTFSVSSKGTASYEIPIVVPPGRNGIQPDISLQYDHIRGNGLIGIGWKLTGLSVIHRCPQTLELDGFKGTVNLNSKDRYCLDRQRLVAVTGAYGENNAVYHTEIESGSKIHPRGNTPSEPRFFTLRMESGLQMEFGNSPDSAIKAPGGQIRIWALNKVTDRNGNTMDIEYHHTQGEAYYPTKISYSGHTDGTQPKRSVSFAYEQRKDVVTKIANNKTTKTTKRLKSILTAVDGNVVKKYHLSYSPEVSKSQLKTIQECGANNLCYPSTVFDWVNEKKNWTGQIIERISDGVGNKIDIKYRVFTAIKRIISEDYHSNSASSLKNLRSLGVVGLYTITGGTDNKEEPFTYSYEYGGAQIDEVRNTLSFHFISQKDLSKKIATTTSYYQKYPLAGLVSKVTLSKLPSLRIIQNTQYHYQSRKSPVKTTFTSKQTRTQFKNNLPYTLTGYTLTLDGKKEPPIFKMKSGEVSTCCITNEGIRWRFENPSGRVVAHYATESKNQNHFVEIGHEEFNNSGGSVYTVWLDSTTARSAVEGDQPRSLGVTQFSRYSYDPEHRKVIQMANYASPLLIPEDITCVDYINGTEEDWWKSYYVKQMKLVKDDQSCGNFSGWNEESDVAWTRFNYDENMNLASIAHWNNQTGKFTRETSSEFDSFGNQLSSTDGIGNIDSIGYSEDDIFSQVTTLPNGLKTEHLFEPKFGITTKKIDVNSVIIEQVPHLGINSLGWVTRRSGPDMDNELTPLVDTTITAGKGGFGLTIAHLSRKNWDKSGSEKTWTHCADDNGACRFSGTRLVRYGKDDRWSLKIATDSVACNNSIFGDPNLGTPKLCQYSGKNWHWSLEHIDSFGRRYRVTEPGYDKGVVLVKEENEYHSIEMISKTYLPYYSRLSDRCNHQVPIKAAESCPNTKPFTGYEYDKQDRMIKVTDANGGVTEYSYRNKLMGRNQPLEQTITIKREDSSQSLMHSGKKRPTPLTHSTKSPQYLTTMSATLPLLTMQMARLPQLLMHRGR